MREIRINGKSLEVHSMTGKVASSAKQLETKVSGGGGSGMMRNGSGYTAPVRIHSTTTTHDQIFLVDGTGKEHIIRLKNWDLACRESNELTAVWMNRKGKDGGPYVAIRNLSTDTVDYDDKALARLARPWWLLLVLILPFVTHFSGQSFTIVVIVLGVWLYLGVKGRREIKASGVLFSADTAMGVA